MRPIYGNGGARDLERAGAIFAGDLSGPKARVLAAVMLGAELSSEAMRAEFELLGDKHSYQITSMMRMPARLQARLRCWRM